MRDRHSVALAPSPTVWPPDDTEESVLGTNLHQTTILNLRSGINEAAALATPQGLPMRWQAGGQTMIRGFRRPDGSSYTTLPDVFVYPKPWDDARGSLSVAVDGPPVLIIEVLSDETRENDLDLERGKGYSYRAAGVGEYLALDPTYRFLADGGRGWLIDEQGAYRSWRREADGRWQSRALPLAVGLEGVRAAVYASDGHRILREGEVERTLQEQERHRREELARLERAHAVELDRLRRRLEELEQPPARKRARHDDEAR